jgi:hypothetical protein
MQAAGQAAWLLMHVSAARLTDIEAFRCLVVAIARVIPCKLCRRHAAEYIHKNPVCVINNSLSASRYVFHFHNHVNSITIPRKSPFSYRQYQEKWGVDISPAADRRS